MKRFKWTVGMAAAGLFLGLKGQDTSADIWWTVMSTLWAAAMGLGIGTIFDTKRPTAHLKLYWAMTFALVSALIGLVAAAVVHPNGSVYEQTLYGSIGTIVGILIGSLLGSIHQRRLRLGRLS